MRIIAGSRKGRRLVGPRGIWMRPTSDRTKEFIFDCLGSYVYEARVLDLFSGTGNLGIEALSRGAREVIFVDKSKVATEIIRKNLEITRLAENTRVILGDALQFLIHSSRRNEKFDLIFADPPYENREIYQEIIRQVQQHHVLGDEGILVLEHDANEFLGRGYGDLMVKSSRFMGDTGVSFYQKTGSMS